MSFGYPDESEPVGRGARTRSGVISRQLGVPLPTSLETAYVLDAPGEYEVHDVMVTGVRTFRDGERGARRGLSTAFVYELDGLFAAHLGDVGHVLEADTIREIGHVDIVCLGIGPQLECGPRPPSSSRSSMPPWSCPCRSTTPRPRRKAT